MNAEEALSGDAIACWTYDVLAIDLDGTALTPEKTVSVRVREEIGRVRADGVRVVIATGRSKPGAVPVARDLDLNGPMIVDNGALIALPEDVRPLHVRPIDRAVLQLLVNRLRVMAWNLLSFSTPAVTMFNGDFSYLYRAIGSTDVPEGVSFVDIEAYEPTGPVTKVWVCASATQLDELQNQLERAPGLMVVRAMPDTIDITAAGVTKLSGLRTLVSHWGTSLDRVCAVGDGHNDIQLLEGVGLGIAMGHAPPAVQAAAMRVTRSNLDDGLAFAIRQAFPSANR